MRKFLLKFISSLVIMLSLGFSWASAQNLSSEKQLLTFGFKAEYNAELETDAVGVINQNNRTVSVIVPFTTDVTALKASFTSSEFSKMYFGSNPIVGTLATSNITPWNYTNVVTVTVEAENKSYEHYVVTVIPTEPSTENDMLTFDGAWAKNWTGPCDPNGVFLQTEDGTFNGNNITFNVPFGARLDDLTVYFTMSDYATCNITSGTAQDFDLNNDGVPEAKTFIVTSQSGVPQEYYVLPIVGNASVQDNLLEFDVPNSVSDVVIDYNSNNITVSVPWSATSVFPTWVISDYAHMFSDGALTNEICSGMEFLLTGDVTVLHFWIQAEDDSEVSEFILTVTKAVANTSADLISIKATYVKANLCGEPIIDTISGYIVTDLYNKVNFLVPYGVTSVTITEIIFSNLASVSDPVGTVLNATNNTIEVTAEDGTTVNSYVVYLLQDNISNSKQLLTFGFNRDANNSWGFVWPDSTYPGVIDQNLKRITVIVPYNTNLYQLKSYFTKSKYSCAFIAESNGTLTPQFSEVSVNNFSNTLTYVIIAEDGTEERYEVTVLKTEALTGNDLIDFQLELFDCFGTRYNVPGVYNGSNINVSVKYGTDLEELLTSFTISEGATVTPAAGLIDFTNPVNFVVTSQAGVSKTYTVTVTPRAENPNKRLLTYWFEAAYNDDLAVDVIGNVNETTRTVQLNIPWIARNSINNLVGTFVLSDGAVMTHNNTIQVSGVSPNSFVTPVVFKVYAENCTYTEYFVNVVVVNPLEGDICETAVPLEMPVINHFGTTFGYSDDYDSSPCGDQYMTGNDKVYTITIPYESYVNGEIIGNEDSYASIHILDGCPDDEGVNCVAFAGGTMGGQFSETLDAGTYYVVVSSFAPPQYFEYYLNIAYQGTGINDKQLENNVKVYPNPTSDVLNISINNIDNSDINVELINITGSVVYEKQLHNISSYNLEINSTVFSNGVYYLKLNSNKEVIVKRIILN